MSQLLIPAVIENGAEKIPGTIMKMTSTGLMIEVEKITFIVGMHLTVQFQLGENGPVVIERVRSVRHYDKFYRNTPLKAAAGGPKPLPKKLVELHFQKLSETSRMAMTKYILFIQHKQATRS